MNTAATQPVAPVRHGYGYHRDQFGDLYLPAQGPARGAITLVHGGFWRTHRGLEMTAAAAGTLAARGWQVWNIEYRRGGPWQETMQDCLRAFDHLETLVDTGTTTLVGHSAGGHLAAWVAARRRPQRLVTLNGVVDLGLAHRLGVGDGAVAQFLGPRSTPSDLITADAVTTLPSVPTRCLHSRADERVPFTISAGYAAKARRLDRDCQLIEVPGHHTAVIEPDSAAWPTVLSVIENAWPTGPSGRDAT